MSDSAGKAQPQNEDAHPTLDALLKRIDEIATLPHVVMRVTEVVNNPKSDAADLREIIEEDPALSTRVFKCINSSAYGLSREIQDLQHAISYLGFRQVCNLAVGAAVCEIFTDSEQVGGYHRLGLWRHLVSVAAVSRMVATEVKYPNPEEAFLAGLLHDLGIILEDQYAHDRFITLMQHLPPDRNLPEIEDEFLGFNHTELGYRAAEGWGLPESICQAIRFHHGCQDADLPYRQLVGCVEVANVLCSIKGITSIGSRLVELSAQAISASGITPDQLKQLTTRLDQELGLHEDLMDLPVN